MKYKIYKVRLRQRLNILLNWPRKSNISCDLFYWTIDLSYMSQNNWSLYKSNFMRCKKSTLRGQFFVTKLFLKKKMDFMWSIFFFKRTCKKMQHFYLLEWQDPFLSLDHWWLLIQDFISFYLYSLIFILFF